jgi:hypothetical protein
MLRYLTVQAAPVMQDFAKRMLTGGNYTFTAEVTVYPR